MWWSHVLGIENKDINKARICLCGAYILMRRENKLKYIYMIMQGINNAMKPVKQSEAQNVIIESKR